ncbi:MAG: serine/threonine-protein kinase [Propioniciclava sp.]
MQTGELLGGRYRLGEPLGRGAMGHVFAATDERLERRVAVKTVDLAQATDPQMSERFRREAIATARLNHPNIVTIFDAGIQASTAYLVMELLPGKPLSQVVREQGPLAVDVAVRVADQVARALEATHAIGVVHRDIKPGNIMIDGGTVTLLDFGIAQVALEADTAMTAPATTLGTAAYMSPEQARGERATPASDVYALAGVLMVMLTGQPPFPGENPIAVLHRQISDPAPRLSTRRSDVPGTLDDLVARMLAKDPAARPDTARVVVALDHLRGNLGRPRSAAVAATAVVAPAAFPGPPAATAVMPTPPPPAPPQRPPSGNRPAPVPPPPPPAASGKRADASGYRRAALWISVIIAVLLGVAVIWALGGQFLAGLSAPNPRTSFEPTTDVPEPSREPTGLPTLPLPTISIPPVEDTAVVAALEGVDMAIGTIDTVRSAEAAQAASTLSDAWAYTSAAVMAGDDPGTALADFSAVVADHEDAGAISFAEATTIQVAVAAVEALI